MTMISSQVHYGPSRNGWLIGIFLHAKTKAKMPCQTDLHCTH